MKVNKPNVYYSDSWITKLKPKIYRLDQPLAKSKSQVLYISMFLHPLLNKPMILA